MTGTNQQKKERGTLVCSPYAMYEVILHLSPRQKEAIEGSGLGNLLKIDNIHIDRNLYNEIARSYDKEKKAFNINGTFVTMTLDDVDCLLGLPSKGDDIFEAPKINKPELFNLYKKEGQTTITLQALREAIINSSSYDDHFIRRFILFSIGSFICPTTQRYVRSEYLNLVDDVDKMRELNWSSLTLNQLLKGIIKFREKTTNIEGNVVDDIRGTIHCNEIPDEKAHDNDSETRSNEDFQGTSEEIHSITSTEQSADITLQERLQESIQTLQDNFNDFTKDFWPRMRSLILDCMENDSKCPKRKDSTHVFEDNSNQSNQSRKRLTGPTGRTYKPTNRTDFIYETRGKKKDIIRTQAQTKKTIVYIEKEDLTQQIIDKNPPKNALRGQKKTKTNGQTPLKNSEELTKKEYPFITYINNTEDNKVMVHIEEVEVKRKKMKVLTQPAFLNDDVMDAYIQCLRYKEKGIRGDGKAFLEMAITTGLLNVEGAHVEASEPRDK
ncbi:Os08g0131600 [Oryza sativa Japonica Group]|uniref:Os08g0131600 protein n=1 Tax=Oryza sativa subsp. japonica TaxID=39947 RepID=A0A0P0XBF6_ORYSJ|nr:Os08g0131600 [Oryza sativa Japonica Group]